jgi:hypothetical protein
MTFPVFRLFDAPLLNTKVTVPCVVGCQDNFNVSPASAEYPCGGTLKGFGFCAKARRGAARATRMVVKRMLCNRQYILYTSRTKVVGKAKVMGKSVCKRKDERDC